MNNAAIMVRKRIEDTSEEEWDRIMAVNAKGVFLGTKHAIPAMREAGGGSIVNIGSTGAHIAVADGSASYPPLQGGGTSADQGYRPSACQRRHTM